METLSVKATADVGNCTKGLKDVKEEMIKVRGEAKKTGDSLDKDLKKGTDAASSSMQSLVDSIAGGGGLESIGEHVGGLVEDFKGLKEETGSNKQAFLGLISSGLGMAALPVAIGLATYAMKELFQEHKGINTSVKETREETEKYNQELKNLIQNQSEEQARVLVLVEALKNENIPRKEKIGTLKELQSINPKYFGDLKLEEDFINNLTKAYSRYEASILATVNNKLDQEKLEGVLKKINTIMDGRVAREQMVNMLQQQRLDLQKKGADPSLIQQQDLAIQFAGQEQNLNYLYAQRDEILKRIADRRFEGVTETDTSKTKKEVETVNDVLQRLGRELDYLKTKELTFKTDESKAKISAIEGTIENLLRKFKLTADNPIILDLIADIGEIKTVEAMRKIKDWGRQLRNAKEGDDLKLPVDVYFQPNFDISKSGAFPGGLPEKRVDVPYEVMEEGLKKARKFEEEAKRLRESLAQQKDLFRQSAADMIAGIGEGLGEGLAKGDIFGSVFRGIFQTFGGYIKQLGLNAILFSKLFAVLKKAITNPVTGIAAGIALIALGSLIQNAVQPKTPAFWSGGRNLAGGRILVGEIGPEILEVPQGSNVVSNNRIGSIDTGAAQMFIADVILRGPDLKLVFNRAEQTSSRNG